MAKLEEVWRRPELLAVTDYAEDFIALFDRDFRHLFVNRKVAQTLGRDPEDFIGKSLTQVGMPAELCALWKTKMAQVLATAKPVTFDSRMSLPGGSFLLETLLAPVKDGKTVQAITAITRDVTAWKRDQALRNSQNEVMRQIAQGAGLPELMATMVRLSEQNAPGRLCSLLLLSEDGRYLTLGCAPNLPQDLIQAICAKPIGPDNACCGAAAYHKRLVVAEDLASHEAWAEHRQLAHQHGLRACWSQPILSAGGELLGTFAMYHKNARAPYENELLVVNEAALMAAIAIPHCREHESLLESETRYRMLTENAANIVSVNDANGIMRYVSPAVEPILGYQPEELVGRPGGEHIHPDDLQTTLEARTRLREQIGSQGSLRYRYRHKDGSWRKLEATAKSSLDHRGNYISVVSARDITEREETTRALQESEERLERALDASRLGMWDWNLETGELIVDWHFSQTLGYARDDVQPNVQWLLAHMHPDDRQRVIDALTANLKGETTYTELDYRGQTKAGDYRWVRTRGRVTQRREDGWALRMSGTNQDIDSERRIQDSLDRALESSGLGLWDWNVETGALFVDERCLAILEYTAETFAPRIETLSAISHPDDTQANVEATQAHLGGKTPYYEIEYRARTGDGNWKWVSSRGRVSERDPQGQPSRVSGTIKDIDAQRRIQQHLQRANTQIQLLLEATDEGIVGLDSEGVCTFVNPAATRFLRLSGEQLLGKPFDSVVRHTADDGAELIGHDSPMVRCLLEGQRFIGANELFWLDRNTAVPVEYSVSPLMADDRPAGAVLIFRDVSDKRALAQQLQHQALHDPLTGLVNRHGFEKELGLMLYNARTHKQQHALCYVDLDHFKLVNDTCGHAAGDELLRQLPAVLQPLARKGDTIARLGGDEFGILLEDCSLEQAARIAESVRDAVRDFRFVWQYRTFTIGASIGVVAINSDSLGLVSVLGAADAACYVAKDQGPNHVHVSYPHDLAIIRRRGEMRWVARIKTALEENQFRLHYQSIAALDKPDASATRHELLLRLVDAKGDLILPGAFLQAAERYQLMPAIDHWVIDHALRFVGQVIEPNPALGAHCFGINLSGESLRDLGLLDYIKESLKQHKVSAARLYFELTETAAISNLGAAVEFMRGLKDLGCKLALDDFGSGMSSFSYLKHLPVDYLKIDGSFIKDIVANPVDQAIVRAVTAVGQQMGIQTIAEYVETKAIRDCLLAMGVNYGQGYGIARPMPLENFTEAQQPAVASG